VSGPQILTGPVQANSPLPSSGKSDQLGRTGFEGMPLAVGGGVLVLAGAGAVVIARRRRSAQVPA
jgi:LPXTG-motif cell wall-anchored protein